MTDIVDDVTKAAREAVATFYDNEGEKDFASAIREGHKDDWWWMKAVANAISAERERSRQLLSEAEKREREARTKLQDAEAKVSLLQNVLRPFSEAADYYSNGVNRTIAEDALPCGPALLVGHLRAARCAINSPEPSNKEGG